MSGLAEQGTPGFTAEPRALAIARIRAALQPGIDAGRFPGAQVYASVNGEVLADVAMGEGRLGTPMTAEAIVSWQCNTKVITAAAVAQLWERGLLDVEAPVARYLPNFGQHGKEAVTLRHLLTHTAKFDQATGAAVWRAEPEEVEELVSELRLAEGWPLGGKTFYSTQLGPTILATIVAKLDGRPFSRYVREEIFGPLGMSDCWMGVETESLSSVTERMAFLYDTAGDKPELPLMATAQARGLDRCQPGTGAVGPMRQLGHFYESMLASLAGAPNALLKAETVRAMTRAADPRDGHVGPFGLGFQVASGFYGRWFPRAFGHEGLRFSMAFADPESGVVVSTMVNGLYRKGSLNDLIAVSRAVHDSLP